MYSGDKMKDASIFFKIVTLHMLPFFAFFPRQKVVKVTKIMKSFEKIKPRELPLQISLKNVNKL
jgi:hypothetical protein